MKSISKEIYLTLTNLGFSPIYLNLCVRLPISARTMFLKEIHWSLGFKNYFKELGFNGLEKLYGGRGQDEP